MVPGTLIVIYTAVDIALDVAVLASPLPAISKLKISQGKRFGLAGAFLLGAL
jgi:hypothetical protein